MFRASGPVTAASFHDRENEIRIILDAFTSLGRDAPQWLAIVGSRKVGKTSLLLEATRRAPEGIDVAVLDVFERAPVDLEVFRLLVARSLDALLADEAGASLSRQLDDPSAFRDILRRVPALAQIDRDLRRDLERLPEQQTSADAIRRWLAIPEDLCRALDRRLVVAIDGIQELASLESRGLSPFPLMRAVWQRHERCAYVISGSAPSVLRDLVTSRASPFFQHFRLFDLGPFAREDAIAFLVDAAPDDCPIPEPLASKIVDIVGGHPFYLQLVGEALVSEAPPYDTDTLKPVLQQLIFSRAGRLSLYFLNEYSRAVGHASTAAATLRAVAEQGPMRLTDVARKIGASTASTARYIERLGDVLVRGDDGLYAIADALFGTWIRWRSPGGTVVPMNVIGDEAEQAVARLLAELGFDLVYQSRASRGAFDLLALRGPDQLGIQVKRSPLPLRFGKTEWKRMDADAERWGWAWALASVDAEGAVAVLDPAKARHGREVRIDATAEIDNLLRWLDGR